MKIFLEEIVQRLKSGYANDKDRLKEDYNIEINALAGGYGYRQILELVQNGADAILEGNNDDGTHDVEGRIHVQLHENRLYVANTGAPLSKDGLNAMLRSNISPKRGNQIGRFGLGFKSLLKLNGHIDIFTRTSGAIRFDPERCRTELRNQFNTEEAPGLRMAWPLPPGVRNDDPLLSKLHWAETIIRVQVGSDDFLQHLRKEINRFPPEFLLFFRAAATLTLDDGNGEICEIRLEANSDERILHEGGKISRWRIAEREASITSKIALDDATEINLRDSVPVTWAVPVEGWREAEGRFWAFFPTNTRTFLQGILNAPWKLNSDRQSLIPGPWNSALMKEAARLIADSLADLSTNDDPGRPLDAFPRKPDRKDVEAAPLLDALWGHLTGAEIIPDGSGVLRQANELACPPREFPELARSWESLADDNELRKIAHSSCFVDRQRFSRLKELAYRIGTTIEMEDEYEEEFDGDSPPALQRCPPSRWFGMIASTDPLRSLEVLNLAEALHGKLPPKEWQEIRSTLSIVLTQSGVLVTADKAVLSEDGISIPGREPVAYIIQSNPEAIKILRGVMGVGGVDAESWRSSLSEALDAYLPEDEKWRSFWDRLRRAPDSVRKSFIEERRARIKIRRHDGRWESADRVLLPGDIIGRDGLSKNSNVLVDSNIHDCDHESLSVLEVSDDPTGGMEELRSNDHCDIADWLEACRERYKREHNNTASEKFLGPLPSKSKYFGHSPKPLTMPRGYALLMEIPVSSRVNFTSKLLERLYYSGFADRVEFGHLTSKKYPQIKVEHPLSWFILKHGVVVLGDSATARLCAVLQHREEPALKKLKNYNEIQIALKRVDKAFPPVPATPSDLRSFWESMFSALVTPATLESGDLCTLWSGAAKDGVIPQQLPTSRGDVSLKRVFVTTSAELARQARVSERITIQLDSDTLPSWRKAGAQELEFRPEWTETCGAPLLLSEVIPELAEVLRPDVRESASCQEVAGLKLRIGDSGQELPCCAQDGRLLLDHEQFARLSRIERLRKLLTPVRELGWLDGDPDSALGRLGDAKQEDLRKHVAEGETLSERLLRAVNHRSEPLLDALGQLRSADFICNRSPEELAELVLAQLGPGALKTLRDALRDEGLGPPKRWGTSEAREFVSSIGFPPEFASSTQAKRQAEEFVSGPIELRPLHDFQEEVFHGLATLLKSGTKRRRAVVSLPTGSGKTRVTVEAAVKLVLKPDRGIRRVIWIAQTDELCEQAVQAFRQVWVNLGAQGTDLRIIRLWGGNTNPSLGESDKPVVVVASIQTLNNRFDALESLRPLGLVVVDECHHAITPSYTRLLRWLDAEASPGATPRDEPPVVGLSATPFRTNDDESERLAKRFDGHWLPSDQDELFRKLEEKGVLAKQRSVSLDSGARLSDSQLSRLDGIDLSAGGLDFERLLEDINQSFAVDMERNERLVDCIQKNNEKSILFFANSVSHANEMSARLNLAGIKAAAVSGETPASSRRYFLERFQKGEIRVLCNHSVLTTGFDAPRTDMVLIARLVFSPIRYMQMVGRGLRGEKNGGTASCRIVTVMDNLGRFRDKHPFHYCQKYFSR